MTALLDNLDDELLMGIGVTFRVLAETTPGGPERVPEADAPAKVQRALDELATNALALRTLTASTPTALAAILRETLELRALIAEALTAGMTLYGDCGWEVRITPTADGKVADVELYRRTIALSRRYA